MRPVDIYLIRGLGREAAHWGEFRDLLRQQDFVHQVHCLELPGTGEFYQLTAPLTIQENAEFLLTQISKESQAPKVILAISLGAMVAAEMLQKRSELFEKAYFMNTSFANLSPIHHRLQLYAFRQFLKIGLSKSLVEREGQVLKMVSRDVSKHKKLSQEWAKIFTERPMQLKNFVRQLIAAATYKISPHAPSCPVVVMNSLQDKMVHPNCSERLAKHWNLPLDTHDTSGHDLAIDAPHWIIEVIRKTLSS